MARKAVASAPSPGLDRRRIGERLEASLAGLQELRLLRERHRETIQKLLKGQEEEEEEEEEEEVVMEDEADVDEEATSGGPGVKTPEGLQHPAGATGRAEQTCSLAPGHPERQRSPTQPVAVIFSGALIDDQPRETPDDPSTPGEARPSPLTGDEASVQRPLSTEAAKAPGLTRGVRVDRLAELPPISVGLERLGSGILLTDGPAENLELDSRPSSGFYDVSDSMSCSPSNSCTSVYSECPSSSRWSMQSLSQLPRPSGHWNRPRSTDDATICFGDLRSQRLLLLSGRDAQAGEAGGAVRRCRVSQRPVSTGDLIPLRRSLSTDPGREPSPSILGCWLPPGPPDRKYRCDLISHHSAEVYHYPSPLHAVALQSPLFVACSARSYPACLPPPREAGPGAVGDRLPEAPEATRGRLDKYISGLVLRSRCRPPTGRSELACRAKSLSLSSVYSQSSSASGGALAGPSPTTVVGGWKLRRRISTCCPASDRVPRSPGEAQAPGAYSDMGRLPPGLGLSCSLPPSEAPLYRGRHLYRELVKYPSPPTDPWDPRPSRESAARSLSEANLESASRPKATPSSPPPGSSGSRPARGRQRKWASVLEIGSLPGRCGPRKPGLLSQAQAFLSRRQRRAFPGDPAAGATSRLSREDLRAGPCPGEGEGRVPGAAETFPRLTAASESRFHRSKSFKELRKKVQLSIRPWSLKVNSSSK